MRVYIGARFSRRAEMRDLAERISARFNVSTYAGWLHDPAIHAQAQDDPAAASAYVSRRDWRDLAESDIMILVEPAGAHGGSQVELGIALAMNKKVFVLGAGPTQNDRANVFHFIEEITHVLTEHDLMVQLEAHLNGIEIGA